MFLLYVWLCSKSCLFFWLLRSQLILDCHKQIRMNESFGILYPSPTSVVIFYAIGHICLMSNQSLNLGVFIYVGAGELCYATPWWDMAPLSSPAACCCLWILFPGPVAYRLILPLVCTIRAWVDWINSLIDREVDAIIHVYTDNWKRA